MLYAEPFQPTLRRRSNRIPSLEYTYELLCTLFRTVGFGRFEAVTGYRGWGIRTSTRPIQRTETLLSRLPSGMRRVVSRSPPMRLVLGVKLVARKL